MKAIHRTHAAAALLAMLAGACVAPQAVAPPPPPAPLPVAPVIAAPPAQDWRDVAITPGDWRWSGAGGQSVARFAYGVLILRCNRAQGTVEVLRAGSAAGPVAMRVITTSVTRPLTGTSTAGAPSVIVATLAATDPLLDAMTFSRGRFAIETAGLPTLYVPSWPEVGRVVQDCR